MSSNNNKEDEIAKIQEKIKKAKIIVERAKDMSKELKKMFEDSGIETYGVSYWDLGRIESDMSHVLNTFRLNLANLRGE